MVYVIIMPMSKYIDIEKQLKNALHDSSMSRAEVVRKSRGKLSEAQLSYFVNGKRSLTLPSAAILAKILGMELIQKEKAKDKKSAPAKGVKKK